MRVHLGSDHAGLELKDHLIEWLRSQLPMSDKAVESGMYLKPLSKKQVIAVMAEALLQDLRQKGDEEERIKVADLILREYPQFDAALLNIHDAYGRLLDRNFYRRYRNIDDMPPAERTIFEAWFQAGLTALETAYNLGFEPARP